MLSEGTTFKEEGYRWVVLSAYLLAALVNSLPVHTFSSINVLIEGKFRISDTEVTLNALLFTIAHPLFAFPCNYLISQHGMRLSFILGAAFLVLGVWLRLLLEEEQSLYCLLGSALAAVGNIFILNTPSKVALNWFRKERAGIVTFTGILLSLLSITIGAAVPGFIIDEDTSVEGVKSFLFYEAVIVTVPMVALAVLFREKPSEPPSKAARAVFNQDPGKYRDVISSLFRNREYLKLMMAMTFSYGTLTALIMILDQLLAGLGYSDSGRVTSITIAAAMIVGIFSNPVFSYLPRTTKAYRAISALSTPSPTQALSEASS
jgi:MFS family permease